MDHVWNSLHRWEMIWKEQIEDEKKKPNYDQEYVAGLMKELAAIQKAMKEIHKVM